jgi:hypothetical protein
MKVLITGATAAKEKQKQESRRVEGGIKMNKRISLDRRFPLLATHDPDVAIKDIIIILLCNKN